MKILLHGRFSDGQKKQKKERESYCDKYAKYKYGNIDVIGNVYGDLIIPDAM